MWEVCTYRTHKEVKVGKLGTERKQELYTLQSEGPWWTHPHKMRGSGGHPHKRRRGDRAS